MSNLPFGGTHYPPLPSNTNSIDFAVTGTGRPGIYDTSYTPDDIYGAYNWCNMPHVRAQEYPMPSKEYVLQYVEVVHRHHKRTPYASNIFPNGEDVLWDCPDQGPIHYVQNGSNADQVLPVKWYAYTDGENPYSTVVGFNGSNCQFPQITAFGLDDSHQHGLDLANLYRDTLKFLPDNADPEKVQFRVTSNVITSQVAGGLSKYGANKGDVGMFPQENDIQVLVQDSSFDSLEPSYPCPAANDLQDKIKGPGTPWANHLLQAKPIYDQLDAVSGISGNDSTGSFDHYYDNLSAKQCHSFPLPCNLSNTALCVTQDLADAVYRLGNWEYSYLWRDAVNSTLYSAGHWGVWISELRRNLRAKMSGESSTIYRHNIAHDGSISSLLSILQVQTMYWPGMGTEVVFELYQKDEGDYYVRVLLGGQVLRSSVPSLGEMGMVKWDTLEAYFESVVGRSGGDIKRYCTGG